MNKIPTDANIYTTLENNEICSHLCKLPKAINKKKIGASFRNYSLKHEILL